MSDGTSTFAGVASYGATRSDLGAIFGARFAASSYSLAISGLAPGTYDVIVYAHSTVTGTFNQAQVVRITIE